MFIPDTQEAEQTKDTQVSANGKEDIMVLPVSGYISFLTITVSMYLSRYPFSRMNQGVFTAQ